MDCQKIIDKVYAEIKAGDNLGEVAAYIPELSKVDPEKFGICLTAIDGSQYLAGDAREPFSIQSIAKVLSLTMAYRIMGPKLWKRVGIEPSGTPFNSLVQLEHNLGIPRNPLINAGAIVICDILITILDNPKKELISFVREISDTKGISFNKSVAQSEKSVGYRNRALIKLMKAFGNIENDIDKVLDFYFHLCSIEMTCHELARTFLYLSNGGKDPFTHKQILSLSRSKRMNAVMQTCGFYDEAGEFSFKVGLPGKSGVGGGIIAVHPGHFSIAVWSPRLNKKGNSYRGLRFLESFTTETGLSVF